MSTLVWVYLVAASAFALLLVVNAVLSYAQHRDGILSDMRAWIAFAAVVCVVVPAGVAHKLGVI